MKRILALLLMLALMIPGAAMADDLAALKATWLSPVQHYYPQLSEEHRAAWERNIANILTYPEQTSWEKTNYNRTLASMIKTDNPRIFWLDWLDTRGQLQFYTDPAYYPQGPQIENGLTLADLQQQFLAAIPAAVEAVRASLPENPDTRAVVTAINAWLCDNNTYNDAQTSGHKADSDPVAFAYLAAHSAYSAMIPGDEYLPVCEGYACAFKILCDEFGLTCISVNGDTTFGGHMWNMVLLEDGMWYLVDVTVNDLLAESGGDSARYCLVGQTRAADYQYTDDPYMNSGVRPDNGYTEGAAFVIPAIAP